MKRLIAGLVLTISMAAAAYAGKGPTIGDVIVVEESGLINVEGSMIGVRFTDDDVQHIGCGLVTSGVAVCEAKDIDGNDYVCFSFNPAAIDAVKSISPYSFIQFEVIAVGPNAGLCNNINVWARSSDIPDKGTEKGK